MSELRAPRPYTTREASFPVPAGWTDGTVNVLRPADGRGEAKLIVFRAPIGSSTLAAYVASQEKEMSQRRRWFERAGSGARTVDGEQGLEFACTYRDNGVELYQRRVTFAHAGVFLTLLVEAIAEVRNEADAILDRTVASVRLARPRAEGVADV
jgi:hypothetical protein